MRTDDLSTGFDDHATLDLGVGVDGSVVAGLERFEYFDVQSGLQIGLEDDHESPMGTVHQIVTLREYKKFGAIMQPTLVSANAMGADQTIHVATYEYDTVPASAFDLPPQIKALIK